MRRVEEQIAQATAKVAQAGGQAAQAAKAPQSAQP
jgi:hypothetical protein